MFSTDDFVKVLGNG